MSLEAHTLQQKYENTKSLNVNSSLHEDKRLASRNSLQTNPNHYGDHNVQNLIDQHVVEAQPAHRDPTDGHVPYGSLLSCCCHAPPRPRLLPLPFLVLRAYDNSPSLRPEVRRLSEISI
ncbi:uncharacterized protein LOC119588350 [Penaeus monodon]|uniref:uncharacterized protein LOC119588350 n=1 Tax=Penaeus monodon TaxID=6687 RepID=UPI0018A786B2|nr:uncharacterized protein LOC119588350 [Penaeus monodon]